MQSDEMVRGSYYLPRRIVQEILRLARHQRRSFNQMLQLILEHNLAQISSQEKKENPE